VVTALLLLAGCGGDAQPAAPEPGSTGSGAGAASPTPPADPERGPVLAAFEGFIAASNAATTGGDPAHPGLARYADGQALIEIREGIRRENSLGRRYLGGVVIVSVEVTQFDPQARPPEPAATVTACLDISDYLLVEGDGQEPVENHRVAERFVSISELWRASGGGWVVMTVEPQWEQRC
jgi:hypothetical protein